MTSSVVVAALSVNGEKKGPHAFLMDLRTNGSLAQGVSVGDMGTKTTGNDLDNAWIHFDGARVARSALLNAHAEVDASGEYRLTSEGIAPFEMIGQRLYTGRVAVAQAALSYRRELFRVTKEYADAKRIWSPVRSDATLSGIPQLRALFEEAEAAGASLDAFVSRCEERLTPLLAAGQLPDPALAHAIATAKVKAVEASIDLCWRLKQEVGSYALMGSSGFVHLDFLNCCKFAEGDSRILMLKMARDSLKSAKKGKSAQMSAEEMRLCSALGGALSIANGDKAKEAQLWDDNWRTVYELAEASMARSMDEFMR